MLCSHLEHINLSSGERQFIIQMRARGSLSGLLLASLRGKEQEGTLDAANPP